MSKKLILIESPGKINSFKKYLSSDYEVLASYGHVFDLPESKLSVNIKKDFEPTFDALPGKDDIIHKISKAAKKADIIYIMTDADTEGYGLGFNLYRFIFPDHKNVKRAVSCEINKKEIDKGLKNAQGIEDSISIVHAYETRRILDRICGYKTSFLTKQATGGKSAGRTQSAGLRVIVEREKEIKEFIPVIYWPISAELLTDKKEKIFAEIKKPKPLDIPTEAAALKIISVLKNKPIKVSKYDVKEVKANAYPPFTTSTLQQSASVILGFSPDRTMKAAQGLYQSSAITYHRTDSLNIGPEFMSALRSHISDNYNKEYLPSSTIFYKTKSKSAQEAHEAIRPTDVKTASWTSGGIDEKKLYDLIWKRTVASQMAPARYERRNSEFSCEKYILSASGSKELFDGFRKVWTYGGSEDKYLPDLSMGEIVDIIDVKTEEHKTQPPPRYSEASFIKELEKVGVGRPATYATIPKTLINRGYIEIGKKKRILATDLGIKVCDFLIAADFCFIDIKFTAGLEDKLDDIANGKLDKVKALTDFWQRLKKDIENSKAVKKDINKTEYKCPKCGSYLAKKHSKFGDFISCSNYPECKGIYTINEDNEPVEKIAKKKEYSDIPCPKCGSKMVKRKSKFGEFLGCEKYPKCKSILDMHGNEVKKSSSKKSFKKYKKKKK